MMMVEVVQADRDAAALLENVLPDFGYSKWLARAVATSPDTHQAVPTKAALAAIRATLSGVGEIVEALEATHRLISAFAPSGFTDPDIGLQLFVNQGRIYAALEKVGRKPLPAPPEQSDKKGDLG